MFVLLLVSVFTFRCFYTAFTSEFGNKQFVQHAPESLFFLYCYSTWGFFECLFIVLSPLPVKLSSSQSLQGELCLDCQGKQVCDKDSTTSPGSQFQCSVTLPVKQPLAILREPAVLIHTEPCTHLFFKAPMKARVQSWPQCQTKWDKQWKDPVPLPLHSLVINQTCPRCWCKYTRELMLVLILKISKSHCLSPILKVI